MARIKHVALNGDTQLVELGSNYEYVELLVYDNPSLVWVEVDPADPSPATPVSPFADDADVLPAALGASVLWAPGNSGHTRVKLTSSGQPKIAVKGINK